MSDASTTQPRQPQEPLSADASRSAGHGRHRGQVSSHEGGTSPRGRHRKPAEEKADTAA
ncbi:hypothetical protein [Streptomyces sp. BK239]|uniref:hypothetical protein n=1 Tax=Streptomyces sp. BK239 TaxID=2512155 RepID=UPI0013EEEAEC|nr:hypothetical protein [Streptomyces sp. BK239]